jgi:hypothetical protein
MMRLNRWTAVAVAAVLIVAGGAFASSAAPPRSQKLKLQDVSDKFEFVDVGRPASGEGDFSAGDMLIFENILRNEAGTKDVGRFIANCTMSIPPMALCRGTLWLEKGKIELSTAVDFSDAETIRSAVTGGTQRYRTARGEAVFGREISPGVRKLTVVLLP